MKTILGPNSIPAAKASLFWCVLGLMAGAAVIPVPAAAPAADPFAEGVRPTPWLSPSDQRAKFRVPAGFEVQLVAAEPDINKPMNLAFDTAGRLWVTTSLEYPYAAPTNRPGRDRLMVFEDFGPDGRARKITEFAGGLNIPIGVYPFQSRNADGRETWKAVVWSIPNIWMFEDVDGDGRADRREPLYGPFDYTRDTHGNQASFRRGFDGWLYATHGFNNDSHVQGRDGNRVDLNSGNTYRMRLDGVRIEHHTRGQVNPFGLAFDPLGNLFSSDCHSEPLYQLLAGGYYPSFGKPHDGLGFAPNMMEKMRGSTAIDGVSICADDLWPREYQGNFFFGDVMASRVMRDRGTEIGATIISRAEPDFVVTDDPWFRPVDTTIGPDGAMYIADFYNRIIGHYEVPLTHPGRDRTSGRIWRVVPTGRPLRPVALPTDLAGLVREMGAGSLSRRLLAMHAIHDRFGRDAVAVVAAAARAPLNPEHAVHALWLLRRLGALNSELLLGAAQASDRGLRVHAARLALDVLHQEATGASAAQLPRDPDLAQAAGAVAEQGLKDHDALVRRCSAEAVGAWRRAGDARSVGALLELRGQVPDKDTHLLYVVRKAIRDQLRVEGVFKSVLAGKLSERDEAVLADVALAIPNAEAATLLLRRLPALTGAGGNGAGSPVAEILKHAARHAPESELPRLVEYARSRIPEGDRDGLGAELERQFALFKSVDDGLQQRGQARPAAVREWGTNLVARYLAAMEGGRLWTAFAHGAGASASPWDLETRTGTDGRKRQLTSSLPHGEALTGGLRSPAFEFPGRLSFWLCGHDGFPGQPAKGTNLVRLRVAGTAETLAEAVAPRNDTARRVTWDLPAAKGRSVEVEAVDGDTGSAYAWLAFGDFEPALPELAPSQGLLRRYKSGMGVALEVATRLQMTSVSPFLAGWALPRADRAMDEATAEMAGLAARSWVAVAPREAVPALAKVLTAGQGASIYRETLVEVLGGQNITVAQAAVVAGLKTLPYKIQEKLASGLASAPFSAETLLRAIEEGVVSARVLQRIGVLNRLKASKPSDGEARVARLTKGLAPADEAREKLLAERRQGYLAAGGRMAEGRQVYAKNCAPCHRLGGEGAVVGPQLEGIGQRGLERLCEDILDPNRNVDRAFRSVLLTLKDGDVVSGLFRREEGQLLVLADSTGKEFTVPKDQVTDRRESDVSLMPENFGETLTPAELNDLLAYLLAQMAVRH